MDDLELFEYFKDESSQDASYESIPEYIISGSGYDWFYDIPEYIISGSGYDWFYDPGDKTMVRVLRGTECVPISFEEDSGGKITVRVPYRFIVLNSDEVLKVGWN